MKEFKGVHIDVKYGNWTILALCHSYINKCWYHLCRCDCGTEKEVSHYTLKNNRSQSYGCHRISIQRNRLMTHGHAYNPLYKVWSSMHQRCENPNHTSYHNYGGRGIRVCEEWMTFEGFYEDMGDRPFLEAQLDRIDTNGNYCKENCRWVSQVENNRNTRRSILITINSITKCLGEWCSILKLDYNTEYKKYKVNATKYINNLIQKVRNV